MTSLAGGICRRSRGRAGCPTAAATRRCGVSRPYARPDTLWRMSFWIQSDSGPGSIRVRAAGWRGPGTPDLTAGIAVAQVLLKRAFGPALVHDRVGPCWCAPAHHPAACRALVAGDHAAVRRGNTRSGAEGGPRHPAVRAAIPERIRLETALTKPRQARSRTCSR